MSIPHNFFIYTTNRLEVLAEHLCLVLHKPLSSPFDEEIIMVQSRGMEKWISMAIARIMGVSAHISFPFPHAFIDDLFEKALVGSAAELSADSVFSPAVSSWRIMRFLSGISTADKHSGDKQSSGFSLIKLYVSGMAGDLKRWQLSVQLANLFDQYLTFRPKMVMDWEDGGGGGGQWQAEIFRDIAGQAPKTHRAARAQQFTSILNRAIRDGAPKPDFLPERISLFGISYLPPFYLNIFQVLAQFTEIHLFLMNPCLEFWGDIISRKEKQKLIKKYGLEEDGLHLMRGNRLLADMGTMGRNFFSLIADMEAGLSEDFRETEGTALLHQIQHDLLLLYDRGAEVEEKTRIALHDRSIQVHVCHSPRREMEVLLDNLLAMLDQDPELQPRDILVMTTDIESMSPYIQAVFDLPTDDPRRLPFSIADRSALSEGRIVRTFLDMLRLDENRFSVTAVMTILENPAVYQRFELGESDLELIRRWITDTRIRWGIDGSYRKKINLPEFDENTWNSGMNQLLLGYALPDTLFHNIPSYNGVEGQEAQILGKLAEFREALFLMAANLKQPRTPVQWAEYLTSLLDRLFADDVSAESEIRLIREVIRNMQENSALAEFTDRIGLSVIQAYFNQVFADKKADHRFLTGGITFCAMVPMRSIPFKVLCMTGLDSDSLPRKTRPQSFDLMTAAPLPGDRSQREEDRYLFLEALISARNCLYISYVGQSERDNTEIQPSVLVSDLLDYINKGFCLEDKSQNIINDHIVTKHRLQAFNRDYFAETYYNSRLFSYSQENYQAAQQLAATGKTRLAFFQQPLKEPEPEFKQVTLNGLYGFFRNPAAFLLNQRLGLYIDQQQLPQDDQEPIEPDNLELYGLSQNLMQAVLNKKDAETVYQENKAGGVLPHGSLGKKVLQEQWRQAEIFIERIIKLADIREKKSIPIELTLSRFQLTGTITLTLSNQYVQYRPAKITGKDYLQAWINHLALNALALPEAEKIGSSLIAGKDAAIMLHPTSQAVDMLITLLELYWTGLTQPLHFFPKSSWIYMESAVLKGKDESEALRNALEVWNGKSYSSLPGEKQDPYFSLCFGSACPLDETFKGIASQIFTELINVREAIN